MAKINVEELEILFTKAIQKLKKEKQDEIELSYDIYRQVPIEEWDSFENIELETGSLFDDIDSLKKIINDNERPFTYVDFDRISSILRAISQTNNPI